MRDSLELLLPTEGDDEGLARFEHGSLEVMVLDLELPDPELGELTESERAIAMLVLDGASNAEIAEARDVAVRTVANQLRSIFQKLGVCSRWDLTLLLTRRSLERQAALAPAVVTRLEQTPVGAPDDVYNSPDTCNVLRAAYASQGSDFDTALRAHDVVLREDGAIPRSAYCALFDALAKGAGRPGLGFDLSTTLPMGSVGLLEWLAASAGTLAETMKVCSSFGSLMHAGAERSTHAEDDRLVFSYRTGPIPRVITDWSFGYAFKAFSRVAELDPLEVHLPYGSPGDGAAEDFFGCRVVYGADASRIILRREVGDATPASADAEVFDLFRLLARLRSGQLSDQALVHESWGGVSQALASYETPRLRAVARSVGTSARTLQRRLATAGLTFKGLVSAARFQRAMAAAATGAPLLLADADEVVQRAVTLARTA